jgi:hypothetical protein
MAKDGGGVALWRFFSGDDALVNLSGRPWVLKLWEGEEEMGGGGGQGQPHGKSLRSGTHRRGGCSGVRLQNRRGGSSSTTKLRQEDKGVKAEVLHKIWRQENGCKGKGGGGLLAVIGPF